MAMALARSLEKYSITPSLEIGAFEALWNGEVSSFKQLRDKLRESDSGLLSNLVDIKIAEKFYEQAVRILHSAKIFDFGVRIDGTVDYPTKLHDAEYPLALFYYRGDWDFVYSRGVSVVGTRNPSPEGIRRAKSLTKKLVEAGFTIYSGLAAGIDTVAHSTAIQCKGKTVAVIGTPLSISYPKKNCKLQEEIAKNHLLISQVPLSSYKKKSINFTRLFFPERNKTMSALSEATIIVEAGETSGTLIQARAALKQKRKVFILKNNFENPQLTWPHRLQKLGAICADDISCILQGLKNANTAL